MTRRLRWLGPFFWGPFLSLLKRGTRFLAAPWYRLRAEVGLPPTPETNPLSDSHSPALVLALFSKLLADKQPDWPRQTSITGFPSYDQDGLTGLPQELRRFLDDGAPPIVFTLGISGAMVAGTFYDDSIAAAKLLDRRAVLILGKNPGNRPRSLPDGVVAFDYAPYSELFPRAAVIVHHGGIGTTGQAMRSGRPMLVMPCAHDQPDNAARVARLGIGRTISRPRFSSARAAAELRQLLDNPAYSQRASAVGEQLCKEDGVRNACDALERLLQESGVGNQRSDDRDQRSAVRSQKSESL